MLKLLVIGCGGALGAVARFATVTLSQAVLGFRFPFGTIIVNGFGALLLGLFVGAVMERLAEMEYWRLFVIVGFLGGYTTFSSFVWETYSLYTNGQWFAALLNLFLTNVVTIAMIFIGLQAGRSLI